MRYLIIFLFPMLILANYSGVYHWGESENEKDIVFIQLDKTISLQIRWGEFNEDGTKWIKKFKTVKNPILKGDKLKSSDINGVFKKEKDKTTLVIKNEIAIKSTDLSQYFSGKYPEGSYKILTEKELLNKSEEEQKIIKNEIFARYGYIFKSGGDMESYFNKQEWYKPEYKNVDEFLTSIEKQNIKLLLNLEKRNKK
ncbi:YARHG domain-containing protein [bacterium]|nr:YARHG domain-containing protein [bacterium]